MTGPLGNSEICQFPLNLNFSLDFVSGSIEILGKQNSLFFLGPVNCFPFDVIVFAILPAHLLMAFGGKQFRC